MSSKLDEEYKRAMIKLANHLPGLIDEMKRLTRALTNMPRSLRVHH